MSECYLRYGSEVTQELNLLYSIMIKINHTVLGLIIFSNTSSRELKLFRSFVARDKFLRKVWVISWTFFHRPWYTFPRLSSLLYIPKLQGNQKFGMNIPNLVEPYIDFNDIPHSREMILYSNSFSIIDIIYYY